MKIHIGSGNKELPGYITVDANPDVEADYTASATELPFENDVAEIVYACHVLEHIPRSYVMAALTEWRRVLRPGGIVRISVPDFEVMCNLYIFKGLPLWRVIDHIMGGQRNKYDVHYTIWDRHYLSWHLNQVGFRDVRPWNPTTTHPPEFNDYSFFNLAGVLASLNLEGTK